MRVQERLQSSFCDHIQKIKGKHGLIEWTDRESLETIKQNLNGNSRVSIVTNNSIDRSIEITTLKNKDLRKMNSLRDLWDNIKQFYIHVIGVPERGNERKMAENAVM